jgi:hypothetical protein
LGFPNLIGISESRTSHGKALGVVDAVESSANWMTQTAGDSSLMDDSSIGPGGVRGGPSFRTMSKQDYLLLYDGIHTLLKEEHVLESIQYSAFLSRIH